MDGGQLSRVDKGRCKMARTQRQLKILEVIAKYDIDTQEELVDRLRAEGFSVTQATISRDIKDMGIVKILANDGRHYKYAAQTVREASPTDKFLNMFKNSVLTIRCAGNLVILRTETSGACPACELIDKLNFEEVLGAVAGDNTIFVACANARDAETVRQRLEELLYATKI